ncbi:hypothetical protein JAAARDRAFT_30997 [Jaapia argillacea MUCL 33604]|uniref:Uncharacterized protein n=1 Tax=Jaapia argillacea MUCL 33604 TaxID=933084 RepID=A0A067Q5V2_9AGAM|nr:hypothetical protein JAAARDRAFT_30997 [Jaapia argillacea MUCL 33604]
MNTALHNGGRINVLPVEILAIIFVLCMEEHDDVHHSEVSPPVIPSQVSRHWRAVSIGTPALWSRISVSLFQHEMLDAYLARSSNHPLDLTLRFNLPPIWLKPENYSPSLMKDRLRIVPLLIHSFASHIQRCRSFALAANDLRIIGPVLDTLKDVAVPRLKIFSLELPTPLPHAVFGAGAPMLTSLSMTSPRYSDSWLVLLPNLTSLVLKTTDGPIMTIRGFCKLLAPCSSLTNLSLEGPCFATQIPLGPQTPISLDSLRHLSISGSKSPHYGGNIVSSNLFDILCTPGLVSLSFSHSPVDLLRGFVFVLQSLNREWCPTLTTLSLEDVDLTPRIAASMMHYIPSVRVLELAGTKHILPLLSSASAHSWGAHLWHPDPRCGSLLPQLETITLDRTMVSDPELASLVLYRDSIGAPLRTVRIGRDSNWRTLVDGWPAVPTSLELTD